MMRSPRGRRQQLAWLQALRVEERLNFLLLQRLFELGVGGVARAVARVAARLWRCHAQQCVRRRLQTFGRQPLRQRRRRQARRQQRRQPRAVVGLRGLGRPRRRTRAKLALMRHMTEN